MPSAVANRKPVVCSFNCPDNYLIDRLFPELIKVEIDFSEPGEPLAMRMLKSLHPSDLVVLHFDVSDWKNVISQRSLFLKILDEAGTEVWCKKIRSVRKSKVQLYNKLLGLPHTCLEQAITDHGKVIVKSDLNAKGWPERRLAHERSDSNLGLDEVRAGFQHKEYVVTTFSGISIELLRSKGLFVERYIENDEGLFSSTFFVGNQCFIAERFSSNPVKRQDELVKQQNGGLNSANFHFVTRDLAASHPASREILGETRAEAFRSAAKFADVFGLDFGTINQVFDDDKTAYIVDVNATPYWGRHDIRPEIVNHLRLGVARCPPLAGCVGRPRKFVR